MHEIYLKQALAQADIRRGFCAPNPAVGAVVVKDNAVLASAFHRACGEPHAEAEALNPLLNQHPALLKDATLYITLEPCSHYGRTPPCTDLIIRSGIRQVVYAMHDPNPQVSHKSAAILKAAGIDALYFPIDAINAFYKSYLWWWRTQRPFITAKIALSLDGKIAGAQGQRISITGATAQQFTHAQRQHSDALFTTAKTIISDDPLFNVRLADTVIKKPLYILDRQLNTPLKSKVFNSTSAITLFHSADSAHKTAAYIAQGARCVAVSRDNAGLDLGEIINYIGAQGVHDLWVEAGGRCFAAFVQSGLAQRAYLYIAPKWLGAAAQTAFTADENIFSTAQPISWQALGEDSLCTLNW